MASTDQPSRPARWWVPLALLALAGCVASGSAPRYRDITQESFLRAEHTYYMTPSQLQSALFKHGAACGGTVPVLEMQAGQTHYGWLLQREQPDDDLQHTVVAELTWLQETLLIPTRIRADVYSYHYNNDVERRIRWMREALERPGVCDPDAQPAPPRPRDD